MSKIILDSLSEIINKLEISSFKSFSNIVDEMVRTKSLEGEEIYSLTQNVFNRLHRTLNDDIFKQLLKWDNNLLNKNNNKNEYNIDVIFKDSKINKNVNYDNFFMNFIFPFTSEEVLKNCNLSNIKKKLFLTESLQSLSLLKDKNLLLNENNDDAVYLPYTKNKKILDLFSENDSDNLWNLLDSGVKIDYKTLSSYEGWDKALNDKGQTTLMLLIEKNFLLLNKLLSLKKLDSYFKTTDKQGKNILNYIIDNGLKDFSFTTNKSNVLKSLIEKVPLLNPDNVILLPKLNGMDQNTKQYLIENCKDNINVLLGNNSRVAQEWLSKKIKDKNTAYTVIALSSLSISDIEKIDKETLGEMLKIVLYENSSDHYNPMINATIKLFLDAGAITTIDNEFKEDYIARVKLTSAGKANVKETRKYKMEQIEMVQQRIVINSKNFIEKNLLDSKFEDCVKAKKRL